MLLSFSPEAGFVLTLFELVLSGLSFLILIWIGLWDPDRRASGAFRLLTLAFALFVVAFASLAAYSQITVYSEPAERPVHYWVLLGSDVARLLGTCCLMAAYLIQVGRKRHVPVVGAAAALAIALGIALFSRDAAGSVASIVPVTTTRLGEEHHCIARLIFPSGVPIKR